MNIKRFTILLFFVMLCMLSLTAVVQGDEDVDSFATGTTITGTVTEVGEGYVSIDGVIYWLSSDIDPTLFVVGEAVSITVVLADDVTMSIISVEAYDGEVEVIDPNDTHPVGTALAEGLGVEYSDIMGWADAQIGFGEIARAYLIAIEAGIPVEEVLAQRIDGGAGWGEIMKQYDVSPSQFAPGRLISGKLVIDGIDLPDDVEPDGTLDAPWAPEDGDTVDTITDGEETVASNQGNDGINKFGCDGKGNSCNAPGQNKDKSKNKSDDD
jgi:hypothetical protein